MKNLFIAFALATALVACTSTPETTSAPTTDSTFVDSASVTADTVAAVVDTTKK